MSYTPPAGNAVDFSWQGAASYTPPSGDAVDFSFRQSVAGAFSGSVTVSGFAAAAHGVAGEFSGAIDVNGLFTGEHTYLSYAGAFYGQIDVHGEFAGAVGASGVFGGYVDVFGDATGAHGVTGDATGQIALSGAFSGGVGISGQFSGAVAIAGGFVGIVYRYEVVGEVRDRGILVDRRVRVYARDSGELINHGDTTAGRFRIHCGFAPDEVTVLPIHLHALATDYAPPCANRVLSELAQDAI